MWSSLRITGEKMVFIRFLTSEREKSVNFSQRKNYPISKHLVYMVKFKNEVILLNLSITNRKQKSIYHK